MLARENAATSGAGRRGLPLASVFCTRLRSCQITSSVGASVDGASDDEDAPPEAESERAAPSRSGAPAASGRVAAVSAVKLLGAAARAQRDVSLRRPSRGHLSGVGAGGMRVGGAPPRSG